MSSVTGSCLSAYCEHMGGTCFGVFTLVGLRWWGRAALRSGGSGGLTSLDHSLRAAWTAPSFPDAIVLEHRGFFSARGAPCPVDGWTLCWGWAGRHAGVSFLFAALPGGKAGGKLCRQARAAPCGRALPEAGRQRVAELHRAASDIKPLRFLALADLRSQALLSSLG